MSTAANDDRHAPVDRPLARGARDDAGSFWTSEELDEIFGGSGSRAWPHPKIRGWTVAQDGFTATRPSEEWRSHRSVTRDTDHPAGVEQAERNIDDEPAG